MPVRALRLAVDDPLTQDFPQSESINARKGIKTCGIIESTSAAEESESINARKGIKTQYPSTVACQTAYRSESINARKGIKTFLITLLLQIKVIVGPNQ